MINKKAFKEVMLFEIGFTLVFIIFTVGMLVTSEKDLSSSLSESLKFTAALGALLLFIMLFIGIQLWYRRPRGQNISVSLLNQKTRFRLDYIDIVLYLVSLSMFIILAFIIDNFVI